MYTGILTRVVADCFLSHDAIIVLAGTIKTTTCTMSNSNKLAAIKAVSGKAPLGLLYCDVCPDTLASDWSVNKVHKWCLDLVCRGCDSEWSVCRVCLRSGSRFKTREQMRRHNVRNHRRKAAVPVPAVAQAVSETILEDTNEQQGLSMMEAHLLPDAAGHDDFTVTFDENWISSFDDDPSTLFTDNNPESFTEDRAPLPNEGGLRDESNASLDFQCFGNAISTNYFKNHHNGHGNAYLVAMSQFNRDNVAPFLEDADVELQMYISFLVESLTKPQRHHFAEVLTRVVAIT